MLSQEKKMTFESLKTIVQKFVAERGWEKYHNPKDVALDISIEANELLELFVWKSVEEVQQKYKLDEKFRQDVQDEFADIIHACLSFAVTLDMDIQDVFLKKIEKTAKSIHPKKCWE